LGQHHCTDVKVKDIATFQTEISVISMMRDGYFGLKAICGRRELVSFSTHTQTANATKSKSTADHFTSGINRKACNETWAGLDPQGKALFSGLGGEET
jgi:hypothetical protein